MDILFKDRRLERLCREEKQMVRALGASGAKKLKARLKDLSAASHMGEIKIGRPHLLTGNFKGCMALDLGGLIRIVLEAADDPLPVREDKSIDWFKVTRVRVVFIGDYHD